MSSLPYSPIQRRNLTHRLPRMITGLMFVVLFGFFGHEFYSSPLFRVQNLTVTPSERVTETAVRHLANLRYSQHLLLMDTVWAAEQIERHPWVKDASVSRSFPSTVNVEIKEYTPTLLLALERMWYVDAEGDIFRAADSSDVNHPILTGIPSEWAIEQPKLVQIVIRDALTIREAFDLPELGSEDNISEIHFQRETGFQVILRNGTTVSLGFYEPNGRVERLKKMVSKGLDLSTPQRIDLDADKVAIAKPLN